MPDANTALLAARPSRTRLSTDSLDRLAPAIGRPAYDRAAVTPGIVHIGLGAFCRAHLATYTDDVLATGDRNWGIVGVDPLSPAIRDALKPQDCLYTLLVREENRDRLRIVGSFLDALATDDQLDDVLALMAKPEIRIVTLTVTEKGYCQDAATGSLDEAHPLVRADLADPANPRSVPGLLAEAIRRRRAAGVPPFTVLVCDNLAQNGIKVRGIVVRYAELCDPELAAYIAGQVSFPCTMVDRITPATQDADRVTVEEATGCGDAWPVVSEPFKQWVIEDRFPLGRPAWEKAGAILVEDVHPFELMKLRCLNGAHSLLAYLSVIAGIETIADAMADPQLPAVMRRLWECDLIPTLPPVPGTDIPAYTAALEARFRNPGIRHRTIQISSDGSQKLPPRLLEPARELFAAGKVPAVIPLAVAAWMRFLLEQDEAGSAYTVADPLAAALTGIARAHRSDASALAAALFAIEDIFAPELVAEAAFRTAVVRHLDSLMSVGVAKTLAAFLAAS
ncbi:mannitol dehydrogenase family protein (plasmid) [Azospirillum oryzae]|uniref:Mannitol dehydrogenase family protein n=1 Tax=Azospirillum oryzae TaxID=286727 RepID=A0A6N1AFX2_9PROT|nr:mannitol dehydrogenase family protein [Azospirillum oryzae]KAA0584426.1 mannitol dehydrogenase family protein [Azospirillum oryzae]QKS50420.1 mannitol dehydrogenase family protein [Azospirillum oryzae]GLR81848.1 mannitol dehydrogenase [Azospirillum oryzae]